MSAIFLPSQHLAAIVGSFDALRRDGAPADHAATELACTLLAGANFESFTYRYAHNAAAIAEAPAPEVVTAGAVESWRRSPLSPVAFLKALQSFEYQSCEHPTWEGSDAHRLCALMRARVVHIMAPELATATLAGRGLAYDRAAWVIGEPPASASALEVSA